MDWHIAGAYVASCSCDLAEHWQIDGSLHDTHGGCKGAVVFAIQEGTSEKAALSGVHFALVNFFPADLQKEGWEMGLIVDDAASVEQLQAIEDIVRGLSGGPFEDLAAMVGEYLGSERTPITIERSANPIVKIGSSIAFRYHPLLGEDDKRITGGQPLFPWATDRVGGKAEGPPGRIFGQVWTPVFSEYARFDLNSGQLGVEDQLGKMQG